MSINNEALTAEQKYKTSIEEAQDYIENFDILETINNVGNDEVFTPVKICKQMLDILPDEVWSNPDYKWLNPSDKNGVFPREIAIRLNEGLKDWEPNEEKRKKHILQNMLYSIGLTKFTSQVSRRTLYYCSDANRKFDGKIDEHGKSINGYAIGNGSWFKTFEGNILNPITKHDFEKNGKCKFCRTNEKDKDGNPGRYSDPKQIEHYAYEFIHVVDIKKHIQKRFFGGKNMKFDIIIGNPPYQLRDEGKTNSASPIYHLFIEQAKRLNPKYLCMITPSRWMAGGKGLDKFRKDMLNDSRFSKFVDYINAKDCFPTASIAGGVNFFLWERDKTDKNVSFTNIHNGIETTSNRILNEHPVLIRYNEAIEMIDLIRQKNKTSLTSIISSRNPFGIESKIKGEDKRTEKNNILLVSSKGDGYVSDKTVISNEKYINKYKVLVSKTISEHAGEPDKNGQFKVFSVIRQLQPGEVCTDSYLVTQKFNTEIETLNIIEYLKTKFVRFLLLQSVTSVSISKDTFRFIPIMDFSRGWTDEDLFTYFNLKIEQIDFINSMIKDM